MYRTTVAPDAPTLARPQLAIAPPVPPAPAPKPPAPKSGWIVGGISFTLAAAALSVIGAHALQTISWSPGPAAVSVAVSTVTATPVAPVPVAAVPPAVPVIPVAPRVVVVHSPAPSAAHPAAVEPETRPAAPSSVPAPPPAHIDPPKHCGDFAACVPLPPFTLPPQPPQNCGIVVCHPRR